MIKEPPLCKVKDMKPGKLYVLTGNQYFHQGEKVRVSKVGAQRTIVLIVERDLKIALFNDDSVYEDVK